MCNLKKRFWNMEAEWGLRLLWVWLTNLTLPKQEKFEAATTSLAEMEERLFMAKSMLEATLQYQSGQHKA
ncbi:hypothetical protein L2E82_31911 [Cichorium intybus]|uniref:Uncharacterized protein n=1 Tax=Cichorium intybus TaxID=13427 RepID=A0ACB9BFS4_CICIN|nr:hypothetical protein L2E82_31911 [Cichorium intybus]